MKASQSESLPRQSAVFPLIDLYISFPAFVVRLAMNDTGFFEEHLLQIQFDSDRSGFSERRMPSWLGH